MRDAVPANTRAYAVLVSDRFMKLESTGDNMILIPHPEVK